MVFSTRREGQVFDPCGTQEGLTCLNGENYLESGTVHAPLIENLAVVGWPSAEVSPMDIFTGRPSKIHSLQHAETMAWSFF